MVFTGRVGVEDECDFADCTMIIFKRFPVTENISKNPQNAPELGMRLRVRNKNTLTRTAINLRDVVGIHPCVHRFL